MSHLALYRKLRPKDFGEMIEQEHVVRILKNQLASGTTSHAYLFCGTRGTGKTSMAKILAKALNCKERAEAAGPCSGCTSCQAAAENRNLNIIEIDAASNNGVDNVREIREEVKYPPQDGGVKVYIIDEVHMLSTGAFNALLKTLEEPPERVVFILATTDAQKIPATILSRCVRLDFKRIGIDAMTNALRKIVDEKGLAVTDGALRYIASTSDGAVRDAYSLLEQCISYYQGHVEDGAQIDVDEVLALTGASSDEVFFELMDAILAFDSGKCLEIIDDLVNFGRDVSRFVSDFTHHLRNLLISGSANDQTLNISQLAQERYAAQAKTVSGARLIELIHEFCALSASLRYRGAFNERVMLECLCIKLCNPQSNETQDLSTLLARLERLENAEPMAECSPVRTSEPREAEVKPPSHEEPAPKPAPQVAMPQENAPEITSEGVANIVCEWAHFKATLPEPLNGIFKDTTMYALGEGLCISFKNEALLPLANMQAGAMSQAIMGKYGKDLPLMIVSQNEQPMAEPSAADEDKLQQKLGSIDIEWE